MSALTDNSANLTTAASSDAPVGTSTTHPGMPASVNTHPDHLPSSRTETTKIDTNTSEALTDPTGPDDQLPNKPKKTGHQNLAGIILEALQDEVNRDKASKKNGSNGSSRQESIASKMLGSNATSTTASGVVSPQSNPKTSPPNSSLQSSAVTSTSDVSKTPVGASMPTNTRKDEASAAVDTGKEPVPPTDTTKKTDGKPHTPFQKYSPLITAAPGTHTAPPGTAMGAPPKAEEKHSKFHEDMESLPASGGYKTSSPRTDDLKATSEKKPFEKDTDGNFVKSGTKDGNAKKTAGPHHHDILNKLDPRVDSDRDGSRTIGGRGHKGIAV